jgi:hypothetical protein
MEQFTMKPRLLASWLPALLLAAILLSACGRTTPPGPNTVYGEIEEGNYLLLDWQQGLRLMIWDNFQGAHQYRGSGSTADPIYRGEGTVEAGDGSGYSFTVETEGGQTAVFEINGQRYDLAQGRLFIIRVTGDGRQVQQLDRDLSGVEPTSEGIIAFGRSDPDVSAMAGD